MCYSEFEHQIRTYITWQFCRILSRIGTKLSVSGLPWTNVRINFCFSTLLHFLHEEVQACNISLTKYYFRHDMISDAKYWTGRRKPVIKNPQFTQKGQGYGVHIWNSTVDLEHLKIIQSPTTSRIETSLHFAVHRKINFCGWRVRKQNHNLTIRIKTLECQFRKLIHINKHCVKLWNIA